MAKHKLRNAELEVHRVMDGPLRVNGAFGPVTVPTGTFVVQFPGGDFELALPIPANAFLELFDISDEDAADLGIGEPDEPPTTKMTSTSTGPDAVIGVGGDFPPDRPDTEPQLPQSSGIGPGALLPVGVAPPTATDEEIQAFVDAHYAERYRAGVTAKLQANRLRAGELVAKYPPGAKSADVPTPESLGVEAPAKEPATKEPAAKTTAAATIKVEEKPTTVEDKPAKK